MAVGSALDPTALGEQSLRESPDVDEDFDLNLPGRNDAEAEDGILDGGDLGGIFGLE